MIGVHDDHRGAAAELAVVAGEVIGVEGGDHGFAVRLGGPDNDPIGDRDDPG